MKVQTWSSRWLNRLYKSAAIILVCIAVIMSALRLLLPYADNYRHQLEQYVNQQYRSDIQIGHLTTGWKKFGPTLVAKNVSLYDSNAVKIFIEEINIQVDFWPSITQRRLKTADFTLIGAKIKLDKTVLVDSSPTAQSESDITGLSNLFLQQVERFTVKNSQLFINDYHNNQRRFLINSLSWLNQGQRHKAAGEVEVDGISTNTLTLSLDVTGEGIADISGQLYLSGENINITPWLGSVSDIDIVHANTDINFQSWLTINEGQPTDFLVQLGENSIQWQHNEKMHQLVLLPAQLLWDYNPQTGNSQLQSSALKVIQDEHQWPEFTIQYYADPKQQVGYISNLDVAEVTALYPIFETQFDKVAWFKQLAPQGILSDIYIRRANEKLQMQTTFSELAWQYLDNIPGVGGLNGQLIVNDQHARLELHSEHNQLDLDHHFENTFYYDSLTAGVDVFVSDNGWRATISELKISSPEIDLSSSFSLKKLLDQPLEMALVANVTEGNATNAGWYFPLQVMDKELVDYLNMAIIDGTIRQAKVVINGPLAEFPFGNNNGVFSVDAELVSSTFQFSPDWPTITDFNANLNFTNQSMVIAAHSGLLNDVEVAGVVAKIDNLMDNAVLEVSADIDHHPRAITNLMMASPLRDSVGNTLQRVIVSGDIDGRFNLTVPLNDVSRTVAQGVINFDQNEVDLTSPALTFSHVSGQLSFVNEQIDTKNLTVNWQNMPVNVVVSGRQKPENYEVSFGFVGEWLDKTWKMKVPDTLQNYAQGNLDWHGDLTLFIAKDSFSYESHVTSALKSLRLDLPSPYEKEETQTLPLNVVISGSSDASQINATIGEQLSFFGELNHQRAVFDRAHLILGQEQMYLPASGFHISVDLAEIDYLPWQTLVEDIIDSIPSNAQSTTEQPLLAQPQRIRGVVDKVNIFGQTLTLASFDMQHLPDWWQVELNAQQLRAQAKLFHQWQSLGANISADFIHIGDANASFIDDIAPVSTADNQPPEPLTPIMTHNLAHRYINTMVPIQFSCRSCRYNKINLGQVDVVLSKNNVNQLTLNSFTSKRDGTELSFSGEWLLQNSDHRTRIAGSYKTKDLETEMRLLGYDSIIRDSGLVVNFDTFWQGAPSDFALARLNGALDTRLDDGYLADVSDKGVRLLSVLSLRSLVRKLSLDFRDIFSKGMFYDEIKGDFTLQSGVLYTENLAMDGTAGDLSMQGNTDLAEGLLDYRMSFVPNVTSSLPVIVAWMTANPVIGLAALAVDGVIQSTNVIAKIDYELTGTVDEPNFKEVDRKSRDVTVGQRKPEAVAERTVESLDPTIIKLKKEKATNDDIQNNQSGS